MTDWSDFLILLIAVAAISAVAGFALARYMNHRDKNRWR